jgi:hypothetical protein
VVTPKEAQAGFFCKIKQREVLKPVASNEKSLDYERVHPSMTFVEDLGAD